MLRIFFYFFSFCSQALKQVHITIVPCAHQPVSNKIYGSLKDVRNFLEILIQVGLHYLNLLIHYFVSGKDYLEESPCPVLGEYAGKLPDTTMNMCAKLWSDCSVPDTMYYSVSDCSLQIYDGL